MKRLITLISLVIGIYPATFADNCSESNSASGYDSDPITVSISYFPCVGWGTITAMTLDANIWGECPDWYAYDIIVNGITIATDQCDQSGYVLTSYLPVNSVSLQSKDGDFIDDFITLSLTLNITYTPGAGPANPQTFTAAAVSSSEIDLNFTPNANNNNIVLVYDLDNTFILPSGDPPAIGQPFAGGTLIYNGNGSSYSHSGLASDQIHYYKAFSYNGTNYSFGRTARATTYCDALTSFPWTEGFENGGAIPDCWTVEYVSGTDNWNFSTGSPYDNPDAAHQGSYNGWFYSGNYDGNTTLLVSPPLDLSGLANPVLTFWHTQANWIGDQDELRVFYRTSPNGTWTLIPGQVYTVDIPAWTEESDILLPNPSSTYFIGFEAYASYGYGVCLDDVTVRSRIIEWTGNISTAWNVSGNWNLGHTSDDSYWVVIPTSPSGGNFPSVPNGVEARCYGLTLENYATIDILPGGTLHVVNP